MAQVQTSLDAAIDDDRTQHILLGTTSPRVVGDFLIIGREVMQIQEVVSATIVKVQRGVDGTQARDHTVDQGAIHGFPADFVVGPKTTRIVDGAGILYAAAGALLHTPGLHRINGTTLAMTLAVPSTEDNGLVMTLLAENASAHVVTAAGGIDGGGASFDVCTFGGALGDKMTVGVVAGLWTILDNVNVTVA